MDLCCGEANALIQVSKYFTDKNQEETIQLKGIDLIDYFNPRHMDYGPLLTIEKLNLSHWNPQEKFDLITIVHGFHYIGDKLKLIRTASNALKKNGLLIGNLDLNNIRIHKEKNQGTLIRNYFKKESIVYDSRKKLLRVEGHKKINSTFRYMGADDTAGPNYTGQDSVNSIYEPLKD